MGTQHRRTIGSGSRERRTYLMVPVRVHDAARVQTILCSLVAAGPFGLEYHDGRLTGIRGRGDGSKTHGLTKAARWLGVPYSTLQRLTHGKANRISWAAGFAIGKRLGGDRRFAAIWAGLDRALTGPKTRRALGYYTGAIEREIGRVNAASSVAWRYDFLGSDKTELAKVDRLVKRLGLPATRLDLAKRRVIAPILSWPPLRKLSPKARSQMVKWGMRFESELIRQEARVLHKLLLTAD